MPPQQQRERNYRVSYRFDGHEAHRCLSIDARTPPDRVEHELRRAAAFKETCIAARCTDVTLLRYEQI